MKLWTVLKAEYRIHASNFRLELFNKFSSISINIYNNDIQNYITNFYNIFEKFKTIKYELNKWYINNQFISEFHNWQSTFIQMKKNKLRNQDKNKINKIDWN